MAPPPRRPRTLALEEKPRRAARPPKPGEASGGSAPEDTSPEGATLLRKKKLITRLKRLHPMD